jgi:hypothetical protein
VNYYHNASNWDFQQADLYLFPVYIFFQDGSFFEYAITPTWQNINFDFSLLGVPVEQGKYTYVRHRINYNTDQSRKYSLKGSYEFGSYYDGTLQTAIAGVRIAPLPNISLIVNYEYNDLRQIGGENESVQASLISGELRLAYNPNIQASAFYQYNSLNEQGRWNIRASWQFAPLSFISVVFNDTSFQESLLQNQSLITKVTYLRQF